MLSTKGGHVLPPYQVRGDGGKGGSGQTLTIDLKTTTPGGAGETALWVMALAALNKDPGLYGKFQASQSYVAGLERWLNS